jgi:hypothetical protein
VSWNGATEVDRWEVLAGSNADQLDKVRTYARRGFETAIPLPSGGAYVAVSALGRGGQVLGTSAALRR